MGLLGLFRRKKERPTAAPTTTTGPAAAATEIVTGEEPGKLPCSCLHEFDQHYLHGPADHQTALECSVKDCDCKGYKPISRSQARQAEFDRGRAEAEAKAADDKSELESGPIDDPSSATRRVEPDPPKEPPPFRIETLEEEAIAVRLKGPRDEWIHVRRGDVWEALDPRRRGYRVRVLRFTFGKGDHSDYDPQRAVCQRLVQAGAVNRAEVAIKLGNFRGIARGYKLVERDGRPV